MCRRKFRRFTWLSSLYTLAHSSDQNSLGTWKWVIDLCFITMFHIFFLFSDMSPFTLGKGLVWAGGIQRFQRWYPKLWILCMVHRFRKQITLFEWLPPTDILSDRYSDNISGILFDISWHHLAYIFWHSIRHSVWHFYLIYIYIYIYIFDISSGILSNISFDILSEILVDILCDILRSQLRSCSAHWGLALVVGVRHCVRGWGPAVPTENWRSRLRLGSGSAHWDLALAVEVRQCQCPLTSGARSAHWELALSAKVGVRQCPLTSGARNAHWELALSAKVGVRQCPLTSGARGWGSAVPTDICSAHWDLAAAGGAWECPLGTGARSWGLAEAKVKVEVKAEVSDKT